MPIAINDSGEVVGSAGPFSNPANGTIPQLYTYSNGHLTSLSFLPVGINDSGQVAGTGTYTQSAYIYDPSTGSQLALGTLPGASQSYARAINDAGQVAGDTFTFTSGSNGHWSHPFLYTNGKMTELGTLGGPSANILAMNNSGQIVGESTLSSGSTQHAFLYSHGTMIDLGLPPGFSSSIANSINSQGQIVGYSTRSGIEGDWLLTGSGFISSNGVMKDLNTLIDPRSGWTIRNPVAINNLGQILAYASNGSIVDEVLLTPSGLPPPGAPVYPTIIPEPSSFAVYALFAAGLALRGWSCRRR